MFQIVTEEEDLSVVASGRPWASFIWMRTFAKFSNVNNDHAVRFSHKYDDDVTSNMPVQRYADDEQKLSNTTT